MLPLRVVTNFVISSLRNFDRMQPLGARGGLVMQGELVDINDTRRKRQREYPLSQFLALWEQRSTGCGAHDLLWATTQ